MVGKGKTRGPKKRGRPPLPKGEGKRFAIGLRVTGDMRRQLETTAKQSGRSLSQAAELRLEMSFERDQWLELLFYNRPLALTLGSLARLAWRLEQRAKNSSLHDLAVARAIQALWIRVIYEMNEGAVPPAKATLPALLEQIGPLGSDYDFDRGALDRLNERIPEMARLVQEVEAGEAALHERRVRIIEEEHGLMAKSPAKDGDED